MMVEAQGQQAGRPIEMVPTPPGFWRLLGGGILAALAPLFGFLIGSMLGPGTNDGLSPLFLCLLIGILIGGVGVVIALLGAQRLIAHRRSLQEHGIDPSEEGETYPRGTQAAESD